MFFITNVEITTYSIDTFSEVASSLCCMSYSTYKPVSHFFHHRFVYQLSKIKPQNLTGIHSPHNQSASYPFLFLHAIVHTLTHTYTETQPQKSCLSTCCLIYLQWLFYFFHGRHQRMPLMDPGTKPHQPHTKHCNRDQDEVQPINTCNHIVNRRVDAASQDSKGE